MTDWEPQLPQGYPSGFLPDNTRDGGGEAARVEGSQHAAAPAQGGQGQQPEHAWALLGQHCSVRPGDLPGAVTARSACVTTTTQQEDGWEENGPCSLGRPCGFTAVAVLLLHTLQSWPPLPDDGTGRKSMSLPVGAGKPPPCPSMGPGPPLSTRGHPTGHRSAFCSSGPSDKLPVAKVGIMWTRNKIGA